MADSFCVGMSGFYSLPYNDIDFKYSKYFVFKILTF